VKLDASLAAPATLVALLATGIVVARTLTAAAPPPPAARATANDKKLVALIVSTDEVAWNNLAVQAFPEDHWSARDDFHARELKKLKELANDRKVPIEDLLRAVDDDLHRARSRPDAPDARGARAVPCKPRPFYD
jgi:hypothetical protein